MGTKSIGVRGIGVYLPAAVRRNEDWPAHIVQAWRERIAQSASRQREQDVSHLGPGARHAAAGIRRIAQDPFQGARERRVAPPSLSACELGALAAEQALAQAGIRADEIDLLLTWDAVPDVQHVSGACTLHRRLGLPARCFSLSVEAACNSFNMQVALAEPMLQSGGARYALLIQVNNFQRVTPLEETVSAVFGDGASAVVLGPVTTGCGLIAQAHRTDGSVTNTLACSVPGKAWYEDGRVVLHSPDRAAAHQMLLGVADSGKSVIDEALANAGMSAAAVDFFACHQGTAWLREAVQTHVGLSRAKALDTFGWTASLGGANLPFLISLAAREGVLKAGDVIATFAGGTGVTYSSLIMRWGD